MKKATFKTPLLVSAFILACTVCFFLSSGHVGVPRSRLEEDLRTSQRVPDDWAVIGSVSDSAAAYIFYPPARNTYSYSIYVNRPGFSFGYFFRGSRSVAGIVGEKTALPAEVEEIPIDGSGESAYVSMNFSGIERVEIDNGADIQTVVLDGNEPFAILLPQNAGQVTFYDHNGNPAQVKQRQL